MNFECLLLNAKAGNEDEVLQDSVSLKKYRDISKRK